LLYTCHQGFFQQCERARDVDVDEFLAAVGVDVGFVKGGGVEDGGDAGEATALRAVAIVYGSLETAAMVGTSLRPETGLRLAPAVEGVLLPTFLGYFYGCAV
jgi:hypothetical protein